MTKPNKIQRWDKLYTRFRKAPWDSEVPPLDLVNLIKKSQIKPGEALDIGCGTGNYSIYLAQHGFEVTAIDWSPEAINMAIEKNRKLKLPIHFVNDDIAHMTKIMPDKHFDFILDCCVLHHLAPTLAKRHAIRTTKLLKSGGTLLLLCFCLENNATNHVLKAQSTNGVFNNIYLRTIEEIRSFYKNLTEISTQKSTVNQTIKVRSFVYKKPLADTHHQ